MQCPKAWPVTSVAQVRQFVQQRSHDGALPTPRSSIAVSRAAHRDLGHLTPGASTVCPREPRAGLEHKIAGQPFSRDQWLDDRAELAQDGDLLGRRRHDATDGRRNHATHAIWRVGNMDA